MKTMIMKDKKASIGVELGNFNLAER